MVVLAVLVLEVWGRGRLAIFQLSAHGGLRAALGTLLTNGRNDSVLAIHVMDGHRTLMFRKYVRSPDNAGFVMELPNASWSEPYREAFRRQLSESGIPVLETGEHVDRYKLVADFAQDVTLAGMVTQAVFDKVFETELFSANAHFKDMSAIRSPMITGNVQG